MATFKELTRIYPKKPSKYLDQALEFLQNTGTTCKIEFLKFDKHFESDEDKRDIYEVTLTRGSHSYKFNFGQSQVNSGIVQAWGIPNVKFFRHYGLNACLAGDLENINTFGRDLVVRDFKSLTKRVAVSEYNVLACLCKYDPYPLESFCADYGYDTDSISAGKIYLAVKEEWNNVAMLWNEEEIEKLQEIC